MLFNLASRCLCLSFFLSIPLPLSLCLSTPFRATCLTRKLGDALKTFENRRQSLRRECNWALSQSRIEPQSLKAKLTNLPQFQVFALLGQQQRLQQDADGPEQVNFTLANLPRCRLAQKLSFVAFLRHRTNCEILNRKWLHTFRLYFRCVRVTYISCWLILLRNKLQWLPWDANLFTISSEVVS